MSSRISQLTEKQPQKQAIFFSIQTASSNYKMNFLEY